MAKLGPNESFNVSASFYPLNGECMKPDVDPDLFLPRTEGELKDGFERRVFLAKQLCRTCTEEITCMTTSLEYEGRPLGREELRPALGIRAGTTDEERRIQRNRKKRPYSGR